MQIELDLLVGLRNEATSLHDACSQVRPFRNCRSNVLPGSSPDGHVSGIDR